MVRAVTAPRGRRGTLTVKATGRGGIPAGARSVVVNVTSPGNTTGGYLTVYPGGTRPVATSLSRTPGATTFSQVTTKLSATGTFTIFNSAGTADVVIDVTGFYGPLAAYTYDGDGLRASRTTTTGTQKFAWDPTSGLPLLLTDGSLNYIYDDAGNPLEQIDAAGVALYYQHDQYGSTRLLTNAAGAIAASYTYNAYGALTARTGTADTPLRWNGQYQDTDTDLYYLRARYYDPATAQFLTRDPLEALTGSAYGYADNDPTNAADPSGMCPFCVAFVVGAVIGAAIDLGIQALGNVANGCDPFDNINWGQVAVSGLVGGGLSGAGAGLAASRGAAKGAQAAGNAGSAGARATAHGSERLAQAGFTDDLVAQTRAGVATRQSDGANVFVREVTPGRFDFIVEGERGVVTAHRGWSQKSVDRIAKNYGWEGWNP